MDGGSGRMNGNTVFGEQGRERGGDLPAPAAAEADEHDIPGSLGVLAVGAPERVQTLAREPVGHQRHEIEHRGGLDDPLD